MAKTKVAAQPEVRHHRRPADQEHITRLLVLGGVIAVLLIAVGLIAFGWYATKIRPLGKTVLEVGAMKYNLGQLERRMDLQRSQSSFYEGQNIFQLADDTMAQLEVEAQFLQGASELGVSISPEDFATEIKDRGGVSEDAEADVYAASFKEQVRESGLRESEFRLMVTAELLNINLTDYFRFVALPIEPAVKANYMVPETAEDAEAALIRLRAGEEFTAVGADLPDVQGTGTQRGGTLDWTIRGGSFLPEEVEGYLFDTAQPGQFRDAIEVAGLFYLVQLVEKDLNRPVDDNGREAASQRDLAKWVEELNITATRSLSEEDENKALLDIR